MNEPTKKEPSLVKGVTRKEWCRQIASMPKKVKHKRLAENAAKARAAQIAKTGNLFGRWAARPLSIVEAPNKWAGKEDFREAISD